ncbi:TPM domain-containing protein, partial [bacterium]|nr:TPM domain-containing protein [bacterium]
MLNGIVVLKKILATFNTEGKKARNFFMPGKKIKTAILILIVLGTLLPAFFILPRHIDAEVTYPDYAGYVNDFAGMLDSATIDNITGIITDVNTKTTAEIAVVTVNNLQGITIEEYAVKLFEKWGIGKKEKNNGVLLLISKEDRLLRIEVGYGLEGALTDLESGRIINDIIVPQFKADDYNTGVYNGVIAIANEIYADAGIPAEGEVATTEYVAPKEPPYFWICCFPFFGLIGLITALVNIFSRRCPKCRKLKLKTTTKLISAASYTSTGKELVIRDCSNCGFHDEKVRTIPRKSRTSG